MKKATIKELAGDHNAAFRLYVTAARDFLHLSKVLQDEKERARCKQAASTALTRAEKIKAFKDAALKPIARGFFSEGTKVFELVIWGLPNAGFGQRRSESSWKQVPIIEQGHITSGLNPPPKSLTTDKYSCTCSTLV